MRAGIVSLVLAYILSQFFRAFLAVMTPYLAADLATTPQVLASASGYWFLAFALMQIPVGAALDRIGPRLTASALLVCAALGAAIFARASGHGEIKFAMILIGIGCSPVLMASYYIFARSFSPAVFGTLAGMVIGIGSLGNLAASVPLSMAVEALGWRGTMWGLAAVTLVTALAIWVLVRDPARVVHTAKGSLFDLLRLPQLWPILLMMAACYAPAAGLRGLWAGPYLADVFGADAAEIGRATFVMGLAMVAGNFAYGPLDRILGTRKWLVMGGNTLMLLCFVVLWQRPAQSEVLAIALMAGIGFFGASFPMVMAHGRAFLPPHLVGRGVTLINLFGIGATGLMQIATGSLHASVIASPSEAPFAALFLFYAGLIAVGLLIYLTSKDRTD
jgi:predicted MFS family arabinose efflux permease